MAIGLGEEFKSVAVPSPELMRTLLYFAMRDSGSVLTPNLIAGSILHDRSRADDADDMPLMWAQYLESVQERIAQLSSRIDILEQASFEAMQEARQQLEATRDAANRATDGRRVYETEDGSAIFDEQGEKVAADEIDAGNWNPDGPSWEQYQDDYDNWRDARDFRDKVQEQKDRLTDDPDAGDLDDIGDALDELEQDMPAAVRARHDELRAGNGPARGSAAASYDDKPVFASAPGAEQAFAQAAGPDSPTDPAPQLSEPIPGASGLKFSR